MTVHVDEHRYGTDRGLSEETLRDFFVGAVDADALCETMADAVEQVTPAGRRHHAIRAEGEFEVRPEHLVRLCDAFLNEHLVPEQLQSIAFCMIASDFFHWNSDTPEADLVAETLHDWASPEMNYPLNSVTMKLFKERLATGRDALKERPRR